MVVSAFIGLVVDSRDVSNAKHCTKLCLGAGRFLDVPQTSERLLYRTRKKRQWDNGVVKVASNSLVPIQAVSLRNLGMTFLCIERH